MVKVKTNRAGKKPEALEELRRSLPPITDWNTSDEHEINRRRLRAVEEPPLKIENLTPRHPVFSNFRVHSQSGEQYSIEIRDLKNRVFASDTVDFQINGLGTDKHIEAVLLHLRKTQGDAFNQALITGSPRIDIVPAGGNNSNLQVERNQSQLPTDLRRFVAADGGIDDVEGFLASAGQSRSRKLRISQEVSPWLESRRREAERKALRREYEAKVVTGEYPHHETKLPLYPYQRQGMLHLAFTERALLADEMGLGKTIQAVAACALLLRLNKIRRVLIVTPASLKSEWEEQIGKFTDLATEVVFGPPRKRRQAYTEGAFFTLVNYEQVLRDYSAINERMQPDVVILDEAQRIKNWNTKTAQAVKRLNSRYAFVLTGTPIENRIDDLYSIVNFIDPARLGPLFRFNREYYQFNEKGRPAGYQNLDHLHQRVRPLMIRRRKTDVETELPERSDKNLFIPMSSLQTRQYREHETAVSRLIHLANRRPLRQEERDRLQRQLAMMRMLCDTPYILDPEHKVCPKLGEIEKLLDEVLSDPDVKVVIFSEWVRMLELVRESCDKRAINSVWHTGSVPQQKRRDEINRFKNAPEARVFLSSDSGGVGLNLQNASVVINCDLPWNPAKLEQRIARVWRKHQQRPVTVINLVAEQTIEHRMLETLAHKQGLADAVLDLSVDFADVKMKGSGQKFLERLEKLMAKEPPAPRPESLPAGQRPAAFVERLAAELGPILLACEELSAAGKQRLMITVNGSPNQLRERIEAIGLEIFKEAQDFEIIDRQTAETLARLVDTGMLQTNSTTRPLYPSPPAAELSAATKRRITELKNSAERKLTMINLLLENGFVDGAVQPLQEAIRDLTCARLLGDGENEPEVSALFESSVLSSWWEQPVVDFMLMPTQEAVPKLVAMVQNELSPE